MSRTNQHRPLLTAMTLLVCGAMLLASSPFASAAASGSPTLIAYWGQNKASNLYQDSARTEQSLSDFCKMTKFTHVHLAYLRDPFAIDDLPGIDFSKHCSFPNDISLSRYRTQRPVSGFAPLFCPAIRDGIQVCQERGKKVLLTISPVTSLVTDERGRQFANTLWNLFFGGQHAQRPFGARKLDGIDLSLRSDQHVGYGAMIQELKRLAGSTPLTITVSPRCDFPDALFGPTYADRILTSGSSALSLVDNINVHFLATTTCSLGPNPEGFQRSLNAWIDFARNNGKKVTVTMPGFGNGYEAFFEAQNGDFADPTMLVNSTDFWPRFPMTGETFQGFGMFDASTDHWGVPCENLTVVGNGVNEKSRYSDVLWWSLSRTWAGQPVEGICDRKPNPLPGTNFKAPTPTNTGSVVQATGGANQFETSAGPSGSSDSSVPGVLSGWLLSALAVGAAAVAPL